MASYYGSNFTNIYQTTPSVKVDASDWNGKVRNVYDSYVSTGVLAIGDKIYLGRVPKGGKLLNAILAFTSASTTGVVDLGYEYVNSADGSNVTNGILSAVDVHTAADTVSMLDQSNAVSFMFEPLGDIYIVMTVTTATDVADTYKCAVQYVLE